MAQWNTDSIPDQTGRTHVITGATSGLGLSCTEALAARGATIVMAVRNTQKGEAAAQPIRGRFPNARITVESLDLASLASVAAFAARAVAQLPRIDMLLNNAGLGMQPTRVTTSDGFEQQFGINHLGHFALTAQLVPALLRAEAPRVVTVASVAHRRGKIHWDDPNYVTGYTGRDSYNQSKLANLMFALELASRATAQASRLISIAAHPGVSATGFVAATGLPGWQQQVFSLAIGLLGQSSAAGALPQLYASVMPDVRTGEYWGPDGLLEVRGNPARARPWPQALVTADRARLWDMSETLTGVRFPPLG